MSNANEPVFPEIQSESDHFYGDGDEEPTNVVARVFSAGGLTKREYFAAMAMQGWAHTVKDIDDPWSLPGMAVALADALIAELEKQK